MHVTKCFHWSSSNKEQLTYSFRSIILFAKWMYLTLKYISRYIYLKISNMDRRATAKTGCTSCTNWTISFEVWGFRTKTHLLQRHFIFLNLFELQTFCAFNMQHSKPHPQISTLSNFICYFFKYFCLKILKWPWLFFCLVFEDSKNVQRDFKNMIRNYFGTILKVYKKCRWTETIFVRFLKSEQKLFWTF